MDVLLSHDEERHAIFTGRRVTGRPRLRDRGEDASRRRFDGRGQVGELRRTGGFLAAGSDEQKIVHGRVGQPHGQPPALGTCAPDQSDAVLNHMDKVSFPVLPQWVGLSISN